MSAVDICLLSFSFAPRHGAVAKPSIKHRYKICRAVLRVRSTKSSLKGFKMATGTVKWFNATKGFGFIQPDDGGADAFVHISAVERSGMREIVEGQKLNYELERDRKSGKMSATQLSAA
jgi:cold shock protein